MSKSQLVSENKEIYDFGDYKNYLLVRFQTIDSQRGARSAFAKAIGCHLAYISQVLQGSAHFTLDQAAAINVHLSHTEAEGDYFIQLVSIARAGTSALQMHYRKKIDNLKSAHMEIKSRVVAKKTLTLESEVTYYSSWHYVAIFVLISIPQYQTKEALSKHLGLPLAKVADCVEFLLSVGLILSENGHLRVGETRIHLESESPLISKHHTNWRMRAIAALEQQRSTDLHFSTVYSMSEMDRERIQKMFLSFVSEVEKVVGPSKEESAHCLAFDFFRI